MRFSSFIYNLNHIDKSVKVVKS